MHFISAKDGTNVDLVFKAIIEKLKPPEIDRESSKLESGEEILRTFLFDARFVPHHGVACLIKIMGGGAMDFKKIKRLTSYHTGKKYEIYDIGIV